MTQAIRKKGYTIEPFTITSETINDFKIIANRRQISESHVGRIHGALLNDKNPIGVLIVNKRGHDMRLIDGNHRIEAIKKFYSYRISHNGIKIECILKVYSELTDEQEREVYSDEAKRKNESYEDRLNLYKDTITFWKLLNDRLAPFPCKVTIYNAKESLRFRVILNAFYTAKRNSEQGYTSQYVNKEGMVEFAKELNYDDFTLFKEFVTFLIRVFGAIGEENIYLRTQFFIPLFDIYVRNRHYKDERNFDERFSRIIGRADLLSYVHMGGREAQVKVRELMLSYTNYHIASHLFI
jgi:hypothetical protein